MNIDGNILLLDPMLGQYAAPVPLPSLKRYSSKIAFSIDDIDIIDAVIFSHDHYDHLDYSTVKQIKNKVKMFFVPYGVANHLKGWGVRQESIIELNWDDVTGADGYRVYDKHLLIHEGDLSSSRAFLIIFKVSLTDCFSDILGINIYVKKRII